MKLHSLVSSLLPAEYREQVLGDMHERGFRVRDVANVLPRVWGSHLVRSVSGPAPRLGHASEEALIRRTQQLWNQGGLYGAIAVGLAGMVRAFGFPMGPLSRAGIVLGVWAFVAAMAYFGRGWRYAPEDPLSLDFSRAKLLADYRQQVGRLRSLLGLMPGLMVIMARPFAVAKISMPAFVAFCGMMVSFIVWTQLRRRQLQREIDGLS